MNQYLIEHKIKTLSQLWDDEPLNFKGYKFRQWDFTFGDGAIGDAWIASKIIEADNPQDAINKFRKELFPIVDRLAFVSQCFMSLELESFLILRKNDNPTKAFFLRHTNEVKGVPLHFGEEEKEALEKIEQYDKENVFLYLREAVNSIRLTSHAKVAMLIAALEGMAGEIEINGKKFTDKDTIKNEILSDEIIHEKIFAYGEGLRNKIFHGAENNLGKDGVDYIDTINSKVVGFFNKKFGIRINGGVVNPHRNFYANYDGRQAWLEPVDSAIELGLKWAVEAFEHDYGISSWKSGGITHEKLKSIKMPDNY